MKSVKYLMEEVCVNKFQLTFLSVFLLSLSFQILGGESKKPKNELEYGQAPVYHAPVFQRGNRLSKPLSKDDPAVKAFLNFYSKYVKERIHTGLPKSLKREDIIAFPSMLYSDVGPSIRDYGGDLPEKDWQYATSSYCRDCHDATLTLNGVNPPMRVPAEHSELYANWSPYGEWSVSLMGLSARDPVFHAQVESERLQHKGVKGTDIDNVCYSCHGPMGQRQVHMDLNKAFNHEMIYSTPDNLSSEGSEGKSPYASTKFAKYGALARDSVSCQVCHHIGPENGQWRTADGEVDWEIFYGEKTSEYPEREGDKPGPPYPFTANFKSNLNQLYVPSEGVEYTEEPMLLSGLAKSEQTEHIKKSEYCGGCHVVIVPKIPGDYKEGGSVPGKPGQQYTGNPFSDPNVELAYEQTTYFEFINSAYPGKNIECQTCHMPGLQPSGEEVVSVSPAWYKPEYPDVPKRNYKRHRLLGINLFVHEMFQQFYGILGLADPMNDELVPEHTAANLLNAEQSIVQHATTGPFGDATAKIEILDSKISENKLNVSVKVTNNSGHKFPSGAGFRRGFIELQVLDKNNKVIWVSGRTNEFGVILGADNKPLPSEFTKKPGELQPHYQAISTQNQVQIYEVRTVEQKNRLTTKTLSLFDDVKDNRILPLGWQPMSVVDQSEERYGLELKLLANITRPEAVNDDPNYKDPKLTGSDNIRYAIPLSDIKGAAAAIRVYMRYQTIPPYYLVDRYADGYLPSEKSFGSATNRLIYLTSRLNTNLNLKSATNSVNDFTVIQDWTMTLSTDRIAIDASLTQ